VGIILVGENGLNLSSRWRNNMDKELDETILDNKN